MYGDTVPGAQVQGLERLGAQPWNIRFDFVMWLQLMSNRNLPNTLQRMLGMQTSRERHKCYRCIG